MTRLETDAERLDGKGQVGEVIAGADGVMGADDDGVKAEQLGHAHAVDGEAGAGEGGRAQRRLVHVGIGRSQAPLILGQKLAIPAR